jgi:hypothetical protein
MNSYKAYNSIEKLSTYKQKGNDADIYNETGIYALNCPDCRKRHLGQTGRSFAVRLTEHISSYKHQNYSPQFAHHLLENNHSLAPIEDITGVVQAVEKG